MGAMRAKRRKKGKRGNSQAPLLALTFTVFNVMVIFHDKDVIDNNLILQEQRGVCEGSVVRMTPWEDTTS